MILETERLILRPWLDEDAEDLYLTASDPQVGPSCGWLPHPDLEHSKQILYSILQAENTWAMILKKTGKVIGNLSLISPDESALASENEAEFGAWIGTDYQRQGLVTEGARAIFEYGFSDLGLSGIWAGYFYGNEGSKRMQNKLGLQYVRTEDKHWVAPLQDYRILHINYLSKEDWIKNVRSHQS